MADYYQIVAQGTIKIVFSRCPISSTGERAPRILYAKEAYQDSFTVEVIHADSAPGIGMIAVNAQFGENSPTTCLFRGLV